MAVIPLQRLELGVLQRRGRVEGVIKMQVCLDGRYPLRNVVLSAVQNVWGALTGDSWDTRAIGKWGILDGRPNS